MKTTGFLFAVVAFACAFTLNAQTPKPLVIQAANMPTVAAAAPTTGGAAAAIAASPALAEAIKQLEQIKAANAETLKKQEETLQHLDQLQKDAEQLKFFSKRG